MKRGNQSKQPPRNRLSVIDSKTAAAGARSISRPALATRFSRGRRASRNPGRADLVFPTRTGSRRDRHNVRSRVLAGAIERANAKLAEAGHPPIEGCTAHTLRRTCASLMFEAGASPAFVMSQLGHVSAAMSLEVYARMMSRDRDTGARIDALVRGADEAQVGTNGADDLSSEHVANLVSEVETA